MTSCDSPKQRNEDVDDRWNVSPIGNELTKSFRSLRRLIGMECVEEEMNGEMNNGETISARRPNATFTSLRKLVGSGTSFCLPSVENIKRSSHSTNEESMSRGEYDDSEAEGDDGIHSCSAVFVHSQSSPSPSPPLAQRSTWSSTPPESPIGLFHRQEDYLDIISSPLYSSSSAGKDQEFPFPDTPSPVLVRNIPVSPIPYCSSDSMIVNERKIKKQTGDETNGVSRSILQDFNRMETKMESISLDEEKEHTEEVQAPPTKRTDTSRHVSGTRQSLSYWTMLLLSLVVFLSLLVTGLIARLYQLEKLNAVVGHVVGGTMDATILKTMIREATGTQDTNFTLHYGDWEIKPQISYAMTQTQMPEGIRDLFRHLDQWQQHLLEKLSPYQEKVKHTWDRSFVSNEIDTHDIVNDTKYYSDLESTLSVTIGLQMIRETSTTAWEKTRVSFLKWKAGFPTTAEICSNFFNTLDTITDHESLDQFHWSWLKVHAYILGMNWTHHIDEIQSSVSSSIAEEIIEIRDKLTELEILLFSLQSYLTKYCSKGTKTLYSKLASALGPTTAAQLRRTWTELQVKLSLYYDESALKQYFQSSNASSVTTQEQYFDEIEVLTSQERPLQASEGNQESDAEREKVWKRSENEDIYKKDSNDAADIPGFAHKEKVLVEEPIDNMTFHEEHLNPQVCINEVVANESSSASERTSRVHEQFVSIDTKIPEIENAFLEGEPVQLVECEPAGDIENSDVEHDESDFSNNSGTESSQDAAAEHGENTNQLDRSSEIVHDEEEKILSEYDTNVPIEAETAPSVDGSLIKDASLVSNVAPASENTTYSQKSKNPLIKLKNAVGNIFRKKTLGRREAS